MSTSNNKGSSVNPRENHERFIACLERHGYSAPPPVWEVMANELGWSIEEVKLYAFRYFVALQETIQETEVSYELTEPNNVNQTPTYMENTEAVATTWTLEESMLFEALLVQYLPLIKKEHHSNATSTWGKHIASMIPNKTAEQVVYFYTANYEQLVHGNLQQLK